ncbi:MAG: metallophosphoesterase [Candidatus Micrarchaeia archaeon]
MEIKTAIKKLSDAHFSVILANFNIGKLIHDVSVTNNISHDEVIRKLSEHNFSVNYLYNCYRAYQKFKTEKFLKNLKASFEGLLTWGFIVNNILEAPEGDTPEALAYWEDKLRSAEKILYTIEYNVVKNFHTLPENIKSQIEGLLISLGYELSNGKEKEKIKIAHISDIHISEKLTTAGKIVINPTTGRNRRLDDIQRCLAYAVDKAIEQQCDFALITEPFDRYNPTPNEIDVFVNEVLRLAEHMPVVIEPGNHGMDRNRMNASVFVFLKGYSNIFVADEPTTFYYDGKVLTTEPTMRFGKKGSCFIHVLPYPIKYGNDGNPAETMKEHIEKFKRIKSENALSVLLTHTTVAGSEGADYVKFLSREPVLTVEDLSGFDYVALGHIHRFQKLSDRIYYAGNIERIDFDEEGQPKGFIIATIDTETKELTVDFIETPATEMKTISVDMFKQMDWEQRINSNVLYRVVGTVNSESKVELKESVTKFQEKAPLLVKVQVMSKEKQNILAQKITDSIQDEEALIEFLKAKEIPENFIPEILEYHKNIKQSV